MPGHDAEEFGAEKYDEFIAATETSWNRWNAALDHLNQNQVESPGTCGEWSVKDLIAHVAAWDEMAIEKVRSIFDDAAPSTNETSQEFNDRIAEEARHLPLDLLRQRMVTNHARLLGAFESASRASNEQLERIEWAVAEDTWKHYDEHVAQVEARFGTSD